MHGLRHGVDACNGYTQGPGYWGKTFFVWPPDPNPTNDWRQVYFNIRRTPRTTTRSCGTARGNWRRPAARLTRSTTPRS